MKYINEYTDKVYNTFIECEQSEKDFLKENRETLEQELINSYQTYRKFYHIFTDEMAKYEEKYPDFSIEFIIDNEEGKETIKFKDERVKTWQDLHMNLLSKLKGE